MYAGTSVTTRGGFLTAAIVVNGEDQPLWRRSDGYLYVAGAPGRDYAIRLAVRGGGRGEAIIGVDGRHIREDEPADFERNQGLVITGSYTFKGYVISDTEYRAFTFADPGASVSARAAGSTGNAGVIGIAVYPEQAPSWVLHTASASPGDSGAPWTSPSEPRPHWNAKGVSMAKGRVGGASASLDWHEGEDRSVAVGAAAPSGPTLGTAMGASGSHNLGRTSFTRRPGAPETLVIGYQTEERLRSWGLITPVSPAFPADPEPWPGKGRTGYAQW